MAVNDPKFLKDKHNFTLTHVGGKSNTDNNLEYIKNQKKVIDSRKELYPTNYEPPYNDMYTKIPGLFGDRFQPVNKEPQHPEKYDPLSDYLHKMGNMDRANVTRYYTEYINIDSSNRNKIPKASIDTWSTLITDPLLFTKDSKSLFIKHENHNFEINDKISISGVKYVKKNLKIKLKTIEASGTTTTTTVIQFTNNSQYMTINMPSRMVFNDNITTAAAYDVTGLMVEIAGVKGFPGTAFIENIPINSINTKHQILLINPDDPTNYSDSRFYIKLIKAYTGDNTTFLPSDYNFSITYYYIAGIPINQLNAEYPINPQNLTGYHLITSVTQNGYYITLQKSATSIDSITGYTGGSDIYVAKILDIELGYPNPNHYVVKLEKTYNNIVKVNLVSSEFPNTEKVIKALPENKKNNKIYWQNLEDGDYVYSVEIDSGNYNPTDLVTEINNKIYGTVKRISAVDLGDPVLLNATFTNNNYIQLSINTDKDLSIFRSFKEALLVKPFIEVNPSIDTKGGDTVTTAISYTITIQMSNHGLSVGDSILISGSLAYFGIPVEVINKEHLVVTIVDKDRYTIVVEHFNLGTTRTDNGGGSAVSIFVPNIFRLRFDYTDTFGRQLGFRNVGEAVAVTSYASIISNKDMYPNEPVYDEAGNKIVVTNNALILSGDNYILMACSQFDTSKFRGIYSSGKVKNAFGKILLTHEPGKVLFNSFVEAPVYMHDPVPTITELELFFYSPDGELFNFNGLDHSFTLEIVTIAEFPKGTGITSNIATIS